MFSVVILLPYNKIMQNVRFICNLLICISIQAIYLCYKENIVRNWNQD